MLEHFVHDVDAHVAFVSQKRDTEFLTIHVPEGCPFVPLAILQVCVKFSFHGFIIILSTEKNP